jgi:hypothetical protein
MIDGGVWPRCRDACLPPEPVIDEALRLLWQSKLSPLGSIRIDVVDAEDLQRDTVRHIDAVRQKAELEAKYGPRPT